MVLQTSHPQAQYYSQNTTRYLWKAVRTPNKNWKLLIIEPTSLTVHRGYQREPRATTQVPADHSDLGRAHSICYHHKTGNF